jgi:hypothetical protein
MFAFGRFDENKPPNPKGFDFNERGNDVPLDVRHKK